MKISNLIVFLLFVTSAFSQDFKETESTDNYVADATITNNIDENSIITGTVI